MRIPLGDRPLCDETASTAAHSISYDIARMYLVNEATAVLRVAPDIPKVLEPSLTLASLPAGGENPELGMPSSTVAFHFQRRYQPETRVRLARAVTWEPTWRKARTDREALSLRPLSA